MKINYAGVDWVTATSKSDEQGMQWWELFQHYVKVHELENLYNERWHNGYYAGVEAEGLRWGFSTNLGYILIASGEDADWLWRHLEPRPKRITRLDLCADVLYESPIDLAKYHFEYLEVSDYAKQRKYTCYTNSEGGSTLYVGSRQSQQYGRLYDKGIESSLAARGKLWRYEVEYKKPLSGQVADHIARIDNDGLEPEIINRVADWFLKRGVLSADKMLTSEVKPILVQKRITTAHRKLAWLRTQVKPTVHQLIEAGLGVDVMHALLLSPDKVADIMDGDI